MTLAEAREWIVDDLYRNYNSEPDAFYEDRENHLKESRK
jgi:hypothetical protein